MTRAASLVTHRLFLFISATVFTSALSVAMAVPEPELPFPVWSTAAASVVGREQFYRAVTAADYLVIGEIHDNPYHHQLQAELLGHFADSHRGAVSVGFEQLSVDQQASLDAFLAQNSVDAAALGKAVNWSDSGWPDFAIYQPLFSAVLQRHLPVVPLMFPAPVTRDVVEGGVAAALTDRALERLRPDTLLSEQDRAQVEREMQDAHCGKLPESMLPAMVDVQIARDAFMAHSIAQAAGRAVLITGNGHARRDRGIPQFLLRLQPTAQVVVVTLAEQSESQTVEEQMRQQAAASISDFVLVTPAHPRDDPCLAFQ